MLLDGEFEIGHAAAEVAAHVRNLASEFILDGGNSLKCEPEV